MIAAAYIIQEVSSVPLPYTCVTGVQTKAYSGITAMTFPVLVLLDEMKQVMFHPRLSDREMKKGTLFWMLKAVARAAAARDVGTGLQVVPPTEWDENLRPLQLRITKDTL